jgi:hypothetical protein
MAVNDFVFGIEEAKRILADLPKQMSSQIISSTAAKSLLPVKAAAKSKLLAHAKGTGEFSKVRFVARGIKVIRHRSRIIPGARVKATGINIPVGKRQWRIEGYAKLLGSGSYKTPNRKGHGRFRGYGNFIADTGNQMRGTVSASFGRNMLTIMDRARDRAIQKYGRRG